MTRTDFSLLSGDGKTTLHGIAWRPDGEPKAIVQISHGMIEYVARYHDFAVYLADQGFLVAGCDHLGHGKSVGSEADWGFFHDTAHPEVTVVTDLHAISERLRAEHPQLPFFLLGHSMGSFLARLYLARWGKELTGAVLVGTGNQPDWQLGLGLALCRTSSKLFGARHRSRLIDAMVFGANNRRIKHPKTHYDWLTKDGAIVEAYAQDPACTFSFTMNGYIGLFSTIRSIKRPDAIAAIPKELPILLASGEADPIGNYGKAVREVYEDYRAAGIHDVTLRLYPNDRHELLNEVDRKAVWQDIDDWLISHLPQEV